MVILVLVLVVHIAPWTGLWIDTVGHDVISSSRLVVRYGTCHVHFPVVVWALVGEHIPVNNRHIEVGIITDEISSLGNSRLAHLDLWHRHCAGADYHTRRAEHPCKRVVCIVVVVVRPAVCVVVLAKSAGVRIISPVTAFSITIQLCHNLVLWVEQVDHIARQQVDGTVLCQQQLSGKELQVGACTHPFVVLCWRRSKWCPSIVRSVYQIVGAIILNAVSVGIVPHISRTALVNSLGILTTESQDRTGVAGGALHVGNDRHSHGGDMLHAVAISSNKSEDDVARWNGSTCLDV